MPTECKLTLNKAGNFLAKKVTLNGNNVEKKANGTETLQIVIEKKIFSAQWKKKDF